MSMLCQQTLSKDRLYSSSVVFIYRKTNSYLQQMGYQKVTKGRNCGKKVVKRNRRFRKSEIK
jgi:hypothetical protein